MKIALLLSGLPRMWQPSLLTQINMLAPHKPDIFFHFWETVEQAEQNQILALTKPVAYEFEKQKDFSSFDTDPLIKIDNINVPSRLASQYHSWKKVAELFAPHVKKYDVALRSRSDLQFVNSVNYIFKHLRKNDIVMPWWDENHLISDLFALGDPEVILYYHRLYDHLMDYAKDQLFNPEALLMKHMGEAPTPPRIITETNQQWFFVRRPHMADYSLDECMKENPGRNKWLDPEVLQSHKDFHVKAKGAEEGTHHVDQFRMVQLARLFTEKAKG